MGSDGSAAGGGRSDLSEWPRSAENEPALSGEVFAGYRNRILGLPRRPKGLTVPLETPKVQQNKGDEGTVLPSPISLDRSR